jgi:hypothetical protein
MLTITPPMWLRRKKIFFYSLKTKSFVHTCLSIQITHSELIPLAKIDCCLELDRPNTGGGSDLAVGGADGAG